jgi:transposase-like protein
MLLNVQQQTIKPIISVAVKTGSQIYTDEYNIYNRLEVWRYKLKMVNHGSAEYARDEYGDGLHEVHVNTQERCWSLLRSWLRTHRGMAQNMSPFYSAMFQFIYNCKKRGKKIVRLITKLSPQS